MKILIMMGGDSPEREVSLDSGEAIFTAVESLGYDCEKLVINGDIQDHVEKMKASDLVFNALHGGSGENGEIQGYLDSIHVRYTGTGTLASAICMDKDISKKLVQLAGFDTPEWICIQDSKTDHLKDWGKFPVVVKPNDLGSTIGLHIVESKEGLNEAILDAERYAGDIMIEEYIAGRELTVGVLGDIVLPVVEIIPKHELYDYECKYTQGMSSYVCPADLPENLTADVQVTAMEIFRALKCAHYARIDFRLDENGRFWFLEANTLPGMTSTSLVPKAAKAAGISFEDLIERIIRESTDG